MVDFGQQDILLTVAKLLSRNRFSYLLSGSLAGSYYGYPRATHDIDFVIEIKKADLPKMLQVARSLGQQYFFSESDIKEAVRTSQQFNIVHYATGIKIDFWIINRGKFEKSKLQRATEIIFQQQKIKTITAEDLILTKLLWCKKIRSERHLRDCKGILKVQKKKIDKKYLLFWIKKLHLQRFYKEIQSREYEDY